MTSKDNLFQLIKSLSQSEKRFFKLEAAKYSKKGDNDYIQLYDLLDKQEVYDESLVKKKLKGSKILKRFSGVKNYLYKMILKSLTQYHAERNSHQRITTLLQQIDILFNKGIYKAAHKLLRKARKIAEEYQLLGYHIILSEWDHRFADLEDKFWKTEKKMTAIQEQEWAQLELLQEKLKLERLHEEVVTYMYKEGMPRTEEGRQIYRDTLTNPILLNAKDSDQYYLKNLYHSLNGLCHYMCMNHEDSLKHSKKRVELFEASPEILQENNHDYAISSFNLLQILTINHKIDEALSQLNKVLEFINQPNIQMEERSREFFFLVEYYHSTNIYMLIGAFKEVCNIGIRFKATYDKIQAEGKKNRLFFVVPVNLMLSHFILEQYEEALEWCRLILNDSSNTVRLDTLGFVRLYHLLIQYELENHSILDYYIDSTQRFLNEHNNFKELERHIIRFVKKISSRGRWDSGLDKIFRDSREKISKFNEEDSYESHFLRHYHLLEWLDSKIQKQPMLKFVQEKLEASLDSKPSK